MPLDQLVPAGVALDLLSRTVCKAFIILRLSKIILTLHSDNVTAVEWEEKKEKK
jgi:hypothetical protein